MTSRKAVLVRRVSLVLRSMPIGKQQLVIDAGLQWPLVDSALQTSDSTAATCRTWEELGLAKAGSRPVTQG
jgi:hypothetical protein